MPTFNFSANSVDFGNWFAETKEKAMDDFACDAGYLNWDDLIGRAEEYGGDAIEIKEVDE